MMFVYYYPPCETVVFLIGPEDWFETYGSVLTWFNWSAVGFLAAAQVN